MYAIIKEISTLDEPEGSDLAPHSGAPYVLAEHWRSAADHQSRPNLPRYREEHILGLLNRPPIRRGVERNELGHRKATPTAGGDPLWVVEGQDDDGTPPTGYRWEIAERPLTGEEVAEIIRGVVRDAWARAQAKGLRGDHTADPSRPLYKGRRRVRQTGRALRRRGGGEQGLAATGDDPHGILSMPEVVALVGSVVE